jgi:hypothetical protein
MVYHRLLSQENEYESISQFFPKNKVSVGLEGGDPADSLLSATEKESLSEQYQKMISELEILKFPFLLDFFGITGESNQQLLSQEILPNILHWKDNFQTEMLNCFKESHSVGHVLHLLSKL